MRLPEMEVRIEIGGHKFMANVLHHPYDKQIRRDFIGNMLTFVPVGCVEEVAVVLTPIYYDNDYFSEEDTKEEGKRVEDAP